MDHSYLI
jgi:hypothetical protein